MIDASLHWLLSYYRTSEISGALFFGQIARRLKPGALQQDVTRHFADEAQHARYWTDCLAALGVAPLKLGEAYQDRYLAEAGAPVNLIEILAVTQVFEQRVMRQYAAHLASGAEGPVAETLGRIIDDERWHIHYVRRALKALAEQHGDAPVETALARYRAADARVFEELSLEHGDRLEALALTGESS
jgi:1,2-phenylacetyl-CoA epoxidase catalytic subunit